MLSSLRIANLGPAKEFNFEFGRRLNFLTGDNGLGKTFVLDSLWWILTGTWCSRPLRPASEAGGPAKLEYTAAGDSPAASHFDAANNRWQIENGARQNDSGLVIYARVDGGFSIAFSKPGGRGRPRTPLHLSAHEVWEGSTKSGKVRCEGFYRDVTSWLQTDAPQGALLRSVAKRLSPKEETLVFGAPERVYVDEPRNHPILILPYGKVPAAEASAGMRRILALAYLIAWGTWEDRERRRLAGGGGSQTITLLVDEVEAHLHPEWQRSIMPSLLPAIESCGMEKGGAQVFATTHSPLVLASMEPHFDDELDGLFLFSLEGPQKTVRADRIDWVAHGTTACWLTSPIFGLHEARSREAERAIHAAKAFMAGGAEGLPQELRTKEQIHQALKSSLPGQDKFWPRWILQAGLEE